MVDITNHLQSLLAFQFAYRPDDQLLEDSFYASYDRTFVIPDEKEDIQGFRDCLMLNHGAHYEELSWHYGPYREYICVARDQANNIVGGANFICFAISNLAGFTRPALTINLNYVFVVREQRGKGYLRQILHACEQRARETLALMLPGGLETTPALIFFEQNDPLRMSTEDYELDSRHSGLDQLQRIALWAKIGARIIDFPYVQPALSPDKEADHNLLYCVIGERISGTLDSCLLKAHMERYFHISVLKGRSLRKNPIASLQINILAGFCWKNEQIKLIDGGQSSTHHASDILASRGQVPSLLDLLRSFNAPAEDKGAGKLHLTVSIRLDLAPEKSKLDNATKIARASYESSLKKINRSENKLALDNAIKSYIQDIADTNRHFFHHKNPEKFIGPSASQAKKYTDAGFSDLITIIFPEALVWTAEGDKMGAHIADTHASPVQLEAKVRLFWYQHVDESLTFNLSFEIGYAHNMPHYYAMSALQKALFPDSEGMPDIRDLLTVSDAGDNRLSLHNYIHQVFYAQLEDLMDKPPEKHASWKLVFEDGFKVADLLKNMASEGQQLLCLARATFLFQDKFFFDILNKPEKYRNPGYLPELKQIPGPKWPHDLACDDFKLRYPLAYLRDTLSKDITNKKRAAHYFLSGFVHKVIDFLRQDSAEAKDGSNFHYPVFKTSSIEEQKKEIKRNEYLLYVNDTCVYEFVRNLRSLENAKKYIGTCPYLFYVHMMTLHDEALIKIHENVTQNLLKNLENKGWTLSKWEKTSKNPAIMSALINQFDKSRIEIFERVEKLKHMNVLRYSTEQEFYATIRQERGLGARLEYWDQLLGKLESKITDIREKVKNDSKESLNNIVLVLAFFSIAQALFAAADGWNKLFKEPPPITIAELFSGKIPINLADLTYINSIVLTFLLIILFVSAFLIGSREYLTWKGKFTSIAVIIALILFNLFLHSSV